MMKQGWRASTIGGFGILAAWFLACAGEDTPPVDDDLRGALASSFGGADGQMAAAGAAAGGRGGATSNGGSGTPPPPPARGGSGGSGSPVGGGGSGSGSGGGNVCDAYTTIFLQKCTGSNCHEDGSINGAFAGENPPVAADLVDVVSSRGEECGVLVDPGDTENSLILQMVEGTQGTSCFLVQMPLGDDNLPADEIECISDWLTQFEN
jgi:hypothetical protein